MRIIELLIDKLEELNGFDALALVEEPAIEADFFAFNNKEVLDAIEFEVLKLAVKEHFESIVVEGKPLFDTIEEAERVAKLLGCEGHHEHEVDGKIWYMPCKEHSDLTDNLLENYEFESFNDYPESAVNAAKRALKWKDEHPDNDCGTRVGWARANQLADRRNISEDTIARMASFARHLQYKDVPYSEGCGGLMVDAWGGQAGIEWAKGKLERIRASKVSLSSEKIIDALPIKEQENIFKRLSDRGTYESKLKKEGYERVEPEEFFKHIFGLPTKRQAKGEDAITTKGAKVLYEYVGPVDSKIRKFCKRMMQLSSKGILWSKTDLQNIQGSNPEFPEYYNIYEFKGSYGCRHSWRAVYLYQKKPKTQKVTVTFMNKAKIASSTEYKFGLDEEKRKVVGPLLIPNKLILRLDEENKPYYVYFSEDTVRDIAEKAMREKLLDNVNLEHNPEASVKAHMTSSWIVEDSNNDKSNMYDMNVPVGTWMGEYKVEDDTVWQMIKDGVVKGFSIEGIFQNNIVNAS